MIDGNISMEEDTELRDLVVQTLENNGVLAKVRAELRASVFLALEEQESVVNPEPLLNKTVKQYLANTEGKILFSLVREFLEYFGLDYTISVYDPETYVGKEYNYMGRSKLCEELGISSTEPLLGELLKNSINGAFNNSKNETADSSRLMNKSCETSTNINNTTFEVSVPKILHNDSTSIDNNSEREESASDPSHETPINVTISERKTSGLPLTDACDSFLSKSLRETTTEEEPDQTTVEIGNNNLQISTSKNQNTATACQPAIDTKVDNELNLIKKTEQLINFDESLNIADKKSILNEDAKAKLTNSVDMQNTNNAQNRRKLDVENNLGKTVYYDEIIVDGKKERVVAATRKNDNSLLGNLPPLGPKTNSIFSDLPPLNGTKTNLNDLKELMDIGLTGDNVDNYDEDFVSSASGSANEQSPAKEPDKNSVESPLKLPTADDKSEEISEEIDDIDEVLSANASCLDDTEDKSLSNFADNTSSRVERA